MFKRPNASSSTAHEYHGSQRPPKKTSSSVDVDNKSVRGLSICPLCSMLLKGKAVNDVFPIYLPKDDVGFGVGGSHKV